MTSENTNIIGKGIYSFKESSLLTKVSCQKISRILTGYRGRDGLWTSELSTIDNRLVSFRDLIEIRAIRKYQMAGLPMQKIRKVRDVLVREFGVDFPFSSQKLKTDGVNVFYQEEIASELKTVEVLSRQANFTGIVKQSFKNIDYEDDRPQRWWFKGRENNIVLDPGRSFGQPIDFETGVPTRVLYDYKKANKINDEEVARDYGVSEDTVRRACRFEESLAQAA